jgi:hypothetical protein
MSTTTVTKNTADSKYICAVCFNEIEKGEPIRLYRKHRNGRKRWAHANCYHAAPGDQVADAEPAELTEDAKELIGKLTSRIEQLEAKLENGGGQSKVIEIRKPDSDPVKIEGTVHEAFELVLKLATAVKPDGSHFNIFLPGPSGSGKSHLARQIAEALELRFGFISCSAGMSESQLLGRMVPAGKQGQFEFQTTQFLECYENGGVFLLDEVDAADSNVMLVVNAALANGHLSVPSRHDNPVAKRHPDFICIAAANTFGRGADRQYVGRNQLDESTLDRFRMATVPMDYNESLERQLCPDTELYQRLLNYRYAIQLSRLERIVSTRFISEAYSLKQQGFDDEFIDGQLFSGWRDDEIRKAKG